MERHEQASDDRARALRGTEAAAMLRFEANIECGADGEAARLAELPRAPGGHADPDAPHPSPGGGRSVVLGGVTIAVLLAAGVGFPETARNPSNAASDRGFFRGPRDAPAGSSATPAGDTQRQEPSQMKMNLIHASVVTGVALIAGGAEAQQAVQWKASDGGNGHWYQSRQTRLDWMDAKSAAEAVGAHLATVTSREEMNFVVTITGPFPHWLGGKQAPGSCEPLCGWGWISGEPWVFANWNATEPNNMGNQDTLKMYEDGTWDDTCGCEQQRFVIEWSADCNNDGIVDYGQCHDGTLADFNGNNIPDCCERGEACVVEHVPFQWHSIDGGNDHWYQLKVIPASLGWTAAKILAQAQGGYLACAESGGERDFLFSRFSRDRHPDGYVQQSPGNLNNFFGPWIGGWQDTSASDFSEPIGGWRWLTGPAFDPTDLFCCNNSGCAGAENWLHLYSSASEGRTSWNDLPDTWTCGKMPIALIIEWSADCNNDGIVDYGQILAGQLADANANGIPDICEGPTCRDADLFRDTQINGADLGILLSQWGPVNGYTVSDIDHDGKVDGSDLGILLAFWGPCVP